MAKLLAIACLAAFLVLVIYLLNALLESRIRRHATESDPVKKSRLAWSMRRDSEVMVVPLCILAAACTGFIVELFGIAEQYGIVLLSLFLLFTVGYFVFHHNREKQIEADIRRAAEEKKQREYEHLLDRHRACLEKLAWCTAEYNRYFRGQGKQRRSPSAVETARQKAELERQLYRIEESIALLGFLPPGQCELARTAAQFRQDRAHTGK